MKVIIAGTREFNDYYLLKTKCDEILHAISDIEIVSGKARGADTLGERYAKERGYSVKEFPADWKTYGRSAGMIRNRQMAEYGDMLIAFWNGKSRGTNGMINLAKNGGLKVEVIIHN
jgi:hypothetical protein